MSRSSGAYHHGNLGPVLEAAGVGLLRTQPHAGLSLRELARQAGVSHNAPYHHFGDRAGLLKRLGEVCMSQLVGEFTAADDVNADPRERAVAIGCAYVEFAVANPNAFALIYDPEVCTPGAPSEAMAPLILVLESTLAEVATALTPGGSDVQVAARAKAMWSTVHGLSQLVIAGHLQAADVRPSLLVGVGLL